MKIICPEKEDTEKPFGGKLKSCRICLLSGRSKDCNEYVSPCKCQGSLKYVHQECLKFWI